MISHLYAFPHSEYFSQATTTYYEWRFKRRINITEQRQLLHPHTYSTVGPHKCISKCMSCNAIERAGIVNHQSMVRQRALSGGECDKGSEVQVLVLAELITKECPCANTELPYYYKWGSGKDWAPHSGVLLVYTSLTERGGESLYLKGL